MGMLERLQGGKCTTEREKVLGGKPRIIGSMRKRELKKETRSLERRKPLQRIGIPQSGRRKMGLSGEVLISS